MGTITPASAATCALIGTSVGTNGSVLRSKAYGGNLFLRRVDSVQEAVALGGIMLISPADGKNMVLMGDALRQYLLGPTLTPRYTCVFEWVLDASDAGYRQSGQAMPCIDATNFWIVESGTYDAEFVAVVGAVETGVGFSHPADSVFITPYLGVSASAETATKRARGSISDTGDASVAAAFREIGSKMFLLLKQKLPATSWFFAVTELPFFESVKRTVERVKPRLYAGEADARRFIERAYPEILQQVQDFVPSIRSLYFWTPDGVYHGPGGVATDLGEWVMTRPEKMQYLLEARPCVMQFGFGGVSSKVEGIQSIFTRPSGFLASTRPISAGYIEDYRTTARKRAMLELGPAASANGFPNVYSAYELVPFLASARSGTTADDAVFAATYDGWYPSLGQPAQPYATVVPKIQAPTQRLGLVGQVGATNMLDLHVAALPAAYLRDDGTPRPGTRTASWEEFCFPAMPVGEGYSVQLNQADGASEDVVLARMQALAATGGFTQNYPAGVAWAAWGVDIYDVVRTICDRVMDRATELAKDG